MKKCNVKISVVISNMIFIIEFFLYLIFISFWIYSLLDQKLLYTNQGGKIGKYIEKYNLKNISSNFEVAKNNKIFSFFKSPNRWQIYN